MEQPKFIPLNDKGEVDLVLLGKLVDWDAPSPSVVAIFNVREYDYPDMLAEVRANPSYAHLRWLGGTTLLHLAACAGQIELVDLLIRFGANVNTRSQWGESPLHEAAEGDYVECVRLLAENGASMDTQNYLGETPLHMAARKGHTSAVEELLRQGASVDLLDSRGATALDLAAAGSRRDLAKRLLKAGAAVHGPAAKSFLRTLRRESQ